MSHQTIEPITRPFTAVMSPPGSKSLTNRALVVAALADGESELSNVLFADDTLVMLDCLGKLGFSLTIDRAARAVRVRGEAGRIPATAAELFCGNSGTTIRFLTAMCALGKGRFTLDGVARMRQRPIGGLVDVLKDLGVRTECLMTPGHPPVAVLADGLAGGILRYGASRSSQFLSAVLMAAPYARHELYVDLYEAQTSWPYVAMTMRFMDHFDLTPELYRDPDTGEPRRIHVPLGTYRATNYCVEPDASNATYFLALAAIHTGAKVTIEGLGKQSLQGDVGFADVLHSMGADLVYGKDFITIMGTGRLNGIEVDLSTMPDTAQTLAVAALYARGETVITGLHTLPAKETDRLAALVTELTKLGAEVESENNELLRINPPRTVKPAAIDTYDDHRMAMSFSLAATKTAGVVIKDAECVNKTYPMFFEDLKRVVGG
jgi:3-phosphoshikimate 1-carboxyvinyltransferase